MPLGARVVELMSKMVWHKIRGTEMLSHWRRHGLSQGTAITQFQILVPCENVGLILPDLQIFKRSWKTLGIFW